MKPFPVVAALFIAVPLLEVYLLIKVGGVIGVFPTIALIVLTAIVGAMLLRAQGLATLARFQTNLQQGELPTFTLVEGMLLLVGGALLLTPGFFTDAIGFLCLIPPTRRLLVRALLSQVTVFSQSNTAGRRDAPSARVIEGEYTEHTRERGEY